MGWRRAPRPAPVEVGRRDLGSRLARPAAPRRLGRARWSASSGSRDSSPPTPRRPPRRLRARAPASPTARSIDGLTGAATSDPVWWGVAVLPPCGLAAAPLAAAPPVARRGPERAVAVRAERPHRPARRTPLPLRSRRAATAPATKPDAPVAVAGERAIHILFTEPPRSRPYGRWHGVAQRIASADAPILSARTAGNLFGRSFLGGDAPVDEHDPPRPRDLRRAGVGLAARAGLVGALGRRVDARRTVPRPRRGRARGAARIGGAIRALGPVLLRGRRPGRRS